MLDVLFQSGWGAFSAMLFFQIPFLVVFLYIVYRKGSVDPEPSGTDDRTMSRLDGFWIAAVIVLFLGVNVASIKFMPPVSSAQAATNANVQDVTVKAESWSYEFSSQEYEVGVPVRFSARSVDTMHSFAVYHPDGRMLFTMMLMPGLETPTSLVHVFTEAGTYKVRCLEYCGAAHHEMSDELIVSQSKS